ncbi:hypothetical protein C8T65DRAFT_761229 [Cerioporus squamosus]|nr:hypothetical protein C8T65DRAFT_761229 [Cerioporus squamosus]
MAAPGMHLLGARKLKGEGFTLEQDVGLIRDHETGAAATEATHAEVLESGAYGLDGVGVFTHNQSCHRTSAVRREVKVVQMECSKDEARECCKSAMSAVTVAGVGRRMRAPERGPGGYGVLVPRRGRSTRRAGRDMEGLIECGIWYNGALCMRVDLRHIESASNSRRHAADVRLEGERDIGYMLLPCCARLVGSVRLEDVTREHRDGCRILPVTLRRH